MQGRPPILIAGGDVGIPLNHQLNHIAIPTGNGEEQGHVWFQSFERCAMVQKLLDRLTTPPACQCQFEGCGTAMQELFCTCGQKRERRAPVAAGIGVKTDSSGTVYERAAASKSVLRVVKAVG